MIILQTTGPYNKIYFFHSQVFFNSISYFRFCFSRYLKTGWNLLFIEHYIFIEEYIRIIYSHIKNVATRTIISTHSNIHAMSRTEFLKGVCRRTKSRFTSLSIVRGTNDTHLIQCIYYLSKKKK